MSARLAPFLQASAFAFRSFPLLFRLPLAFAPLGNKRHHHHLITPRASCRPTDGEWGPMPCELLPPAESGSAFLSARPTAAEKCACPTQASVSTNGH